MIELVFEKNVVNDSLFEVIKPMSQFTYSGMFSKNQVVLITKDTLQYFNGVSTLHKNVNLQKLCDYIIGLNPLQISKAYELGNGFVVKVDEKENTLIIHVDETVEMEGQNISQEAMKMVGHEEEEMKVVCTSPKDIIPSLSFLSNFYSIDFTKPSLQGVYRYGNQLYAGTSTCLVRLTLEDKPVEVEEYFFNRDFVEMMMQCSSITSICCTENTTVAVLDKKGEFYFKVPNIKEKWVDFRPVFEGANEVDQFIGEIVIDESVTQAFEKLYHLMPSALHDEVLKFHVKKGMLYASSYSKSLNTKVEAKICPFKDTDETFTVEIVAFRDLIASQKMNRIRVSEKMLIWDGERARALMIRRR